VRGDLYMLRGALDMLGLLGRIRLREPGDMAPGVVVVVVVVKVECVMTCNGARLAGGGGVLMAKL